MKYKGSYNQLLNSTEINQIVIQWAFEGDNFDAGFRYDDPKTTFPKIWDRLDKVDKDLREAFEDTELLFARAQDDDLKFSFNKLSRTEDSKGKPAFISFPKITIRLAKDFSVGLFPK